MSTNPLGAEEWEEVKSSNIKAIGIKGEYLIVEFRKGGDIYRYRGFADLYDDMISSPSVGKFFNQEVLSQTMGQKLKLGEWPED